MAEYIERQAAIDKIDERKRKLIYCFGFENDAVKMMDIAKSIVIAIPSVQPELEPADVVPAVHAHWKDNKNGTVSCSRCSTWFQKERVPYLRFCGYCGARMDGEGEE